MKPCLLGLGWNWLTPNPLLRSQFFLAISAITFYWALGIGGVEDAILFALEQAIQADRLRCEKLLGNPMKRRGGRRRTTWKNYWNHGQTQNIRVPVTLAPAILQYAKAIDCGMLTPLSQEQYQQIILLAIDQFVEERKAEFHPNQYSRTSSTTSRRWDELRRFRSAIANPNPARSGSILQSPGATVRR